MKKYSRLFEAKDKIDVEDYIDELEKKESGFVSYALTGDKRKKFVKMHSSKEYQWKFIVETTETEKEITKLENRLSTLKKQGWKVFMDDDNHNQTALVLYRKK